MLNDRRIIEIVVEHFNSKPTSSARPTTGLRTVAPPSVENRVCLINARSGVVGGPATNAYLHHPDTLHVSLERGTLADWKSATFKVLTGDQLTQTAENRQPRLIQWR